MADVGVDGDALLIKLSRKDRVLSLHRSDFRIPLRDIRSARIVPRALSEVPPLRVPGTGIPGAVAVGTFRPWRNRSPRTFALVYGNRAGVVIDYTGGDFDRVIITVDDPEALIEQLAA